MRTVEKMSKPKKLEQEIKSWRDAEKSRYTQIFFWLLLFFEIVVVFFVLTSDESTFLNNINNFINNHIRGQAVVGASILVIATLLIPPFVLNKYLLPPFYPVKSEKQIIFKIKEIKNKKIKIKERERIKYQSQKVSDDAQTISSPPKTNDLTSQTSISKKQKRSEEEIVLSVIIGHLVVIGGLMIFYIYLPLFFLISVSIGMVPIVMVVILLGWNLFLLSLQSPLFLFKYLKKHYYDKAITFENWLENSYGLRDINAATKLSAINDVDLDKEFRNHNKIEIYLETSVCPLIWQIVGTCYFVICAVLLIYFEIWNNLNL